MRNRPQGPSLPKSILDHIESGVSPARPRRKNHAPGTLSRKDARKQERLDRKKRRADHFSSIHDDTRQEPAPKRKKTIVRFADDDEPLSSHSNAAQRVAEVNAKPTPLERLVRQVDQKPAASRVSRTRAEAEEDAYIAYLEAKLGYVNGSTRRKEDDADGLDDLLDFANTLEGSLLDMPGHSGSGSLGMDEASDDLMEESLADEDEEDDSPVEDDESDDGDEWTGLAMSDDEPSEHDQATADTNVEEAETGPPGRYVPPGLRKPESEGENITKLTRQLKGLINRMSEQNMSTVLDAVEEVYRKHRRHDVTSTLTTLIVDGISSHAMLLDSFVVLHAAFVSSLHRLIGVEFAAFVVQNIVSAYERHLREYESDVSESEERGKECSNLLVLLSELYNFQVISCILLYDVIKDLLCKTLSEFRVELLLKILRSSGQQLRQDDPSALKDIVTLAQSSIANQSDNLSSRTKFMIETLTNLKNNKTKKGATQHQGGDAVERMKKFLSSLGKKRHVQAHEALRVSLDDLRTAETRGKWWLVGAAWGGDPLVDHQRDAFEKQTEEDVGNTALVKLARKQGMNTDIRRSIFVVLMSSDDYLDACDRLAQLNLSEVQQREIVRVLLHCCGNEKSYNPYYALVCQHLCQRSHAYRITLQFCLWDFLRDLGETNVGGAEIVKNLKDGDYGGRFALKTVSSSRIKNVAKAYGWWIAKDCCAITILKPIDFTVLKSPSRTFLKELFVHLFVASQTSSPVLTGDADEHASRNRGAVEDIFSKAAQIENLGLGLVFFLSDAFKGEEGLLGWASGVAKETLQMGMNEIPRL